MKIRTKRDQSKVYFNYGKQGGFIQTSNWGDKLLYDGSTLTNKDAFIYGGALTLELEAYLTDRVVLLLNGRERCLWGSSIGNFHTQFGIGLKFIIN